MARVPEPREISTAMSADWRCAQDSSKALSILATDGSLYVGLGTLHRTPARPRRAKAKGNMLINVVDLCMCRVQAKLWRASCSC